MKPHWYQPHRTLKGRLSLTALLALTVSGLLFGITLSAITKHNGERAVDNDLRQRVDGILDRDVHAHFLPEDREPPGPPPKAESDDAGDERLLTGSGTFVQIIDDQGNVLQQRGDLPNNLPPPSKNNGFHTITIQDEEWRTLTVQLSSDHKLRVRMATSLAAVNEQVDNIRHLILLLGGCALLITAIITWVLTRVAIRPLDRLRQGAEQVSTTDDLQTRLSANEGPQETQELAASLNAMLARLEHSAQELHQALQATRRFAADAGHELRTPLTSLRANLDTVMRNPDLPQSEYNTLLEEMKTEQDRLVKILSGLQALARGKASEALPKETVDLGDLLDTAVVHAKRRHPQVSYEFIDTNPSESVLFLGWPDGLRLLFDNLLENAALHGKQKGCHVCITLAQEGTTITVSIEDNGKGIAKSEREKLIEPFCRGADTTADGTGLGLAIVAQQVAIHKGTLSLSDSRLGGLEVKVQLTKSS